MTTYKTGKVYKIIHNQSDVVYVGSTMQKRLNDRWRHHKGHYNAWLKENGKTACSIYYHFKEHGIENFQIVLIKEYQVCDRKHLGSWEQFWINKLSCCNKQKVFQILPKHHEKLRGKQYYSTNKDTINQKKKEYYNANRDMIIQKQKEYNDLNKESVKIKNKVYYEANKSTISQKNKQYYEANKDTIIQKNKEYREANKEKITCECGFTITKGSFARHRKSQRHQSWAAANLQT